ncbi:MAG: universal stress protein [Rhodospirillaceae bacterium]
MALKDILVICDDTAAAGRRIEVAAALAADHDADLTGLYIRPPVVLPGSFETYFTDEMRAAFREEQEARIAVAALGFEERLRRAGRLARSEWRVTFGDPTDVAVHHGRCRDLVVAGQDDPEAPGDEDRVHPERLVFECGRPVLVVPYVGRFPTVGRRVLVGWNGSREAARALGDAMPLLERAQGVTLLAVNPETGADPDSDSESGNEPGRRVVRHLTRHGIAAEASHFVCESHEVGDTLLNTTTDLGSDLIVMGAYGRSRLRSLVLGSLTGFILRHMTVPVLLCH